MAIPFLTISILLAPSFLANHTEAVHLLPAQEYARQAQIERCPFVMLGFKRLFALPLFLAFTSFTVTCANPLPPASEALEPTGSEHSPMLAGAYINEVIVRIHKYRLRANPSDLSEPKYWVEPTRIGFDLTFFTTERHEYNKLSITTEFDPVRYVPRNGGYETVPVQEAVDDGTYEGEIGDPATSSRQTN